MNRRPTKENNLKKIGFRNETGKNSFLDIESVGNGEQTKKKGFISDE